jgi:hypothetical protein
MTMMVAAAPKRRVNSAVASIAYRAGAAVGGNLTTFALAIPATAQVGDVALLFFDYSIISGNTVLSGPNLSWTQIGTEQQDAAEVGSRVYWRTLVGGDPGTTISITVVTGPAKGNMFIEVYSGVHTVPIAGFQQASEVGTTDQHGTPGVVNNTLNAWRVDFVNDKTGAGANTSIWSVPASTALKRHDNYNTPSAGAFSGVVGDSNGPVTANGATQGLQVYDSDQAASKVTMWTILLAPSGGTGGNPPPPPPPPTGQMVIGMYNNCTILNTDGYAAGGGYPGDTSANYRIICDAYLDPAIMKVRRCFSGGLPSTYAGSAGANDVAQGIVSCLSVKSDPAGTAAGNFNATISSLAASMPNGSYLIWHHEPEGDMSASAFVNAFRVFYTAAKAGNANVLVGPAHLGYGWRPGSNTVVNPDDWWVGASFCDWIGVDSYQFDWQTAQSMEFDPFHRRWHDYMVTKGKPLCLTEYAVLTDSQDPNHLGQHPDSQRVPAIGQSMDWFASTGKYGFVLYWNGYHSDAGTHDQELTPTKSHPAGRPTVLNMWMQKLAAYGSPSSDIRTLTYK